MKRQHSEVLLENWKNPEIRRKTIESMIKTHTDPTSGYHTSPLLTTESRSARMTDSVLLPLPTGPANSNLIIAL